MKIERSEEWWRKKAELEKNILVPSRWRHKKRGSEYTFLTVARLQCSSNELLDDIEVVIYQGDDGQIWVRPRLEFFDGRFEKVDQ